MTQLSPQLRKKLFGLLLALITLATCWHGATLSAIRMEQGGDPICKIA